MAQEMQHSLARDEVHIPSVSPTPAMELKKYPFARALIASLGLTTPESLAHSEDGPPPRLSVCQLAHCGRGISGDWEGGGRKIQKGTERHRKTQKDMERHRKTQKGEQRVPDVCVCHTRPRYDILTRLSLFNSFSFSLSLSLYSASLSLFLSLFCLSLSLTLSLPSFLSALSCR